MGRPEDWNLRLSSLTSQNLGIRSDARPAAFKQSTDAPILSIGISRDHQGLSSLLFGVCRKRGKRILRRASTENSVSFHLAICLWAAQKVGKSKRSRCKPRPQRRPLRTVPAAWPCRYYIKAQIISLRS